MPQFKPFRAYLPAIEHMFYKDQQCLLPDMPFKLPNLSELFGAANPALKLNSPDLKEALGLALKAKEKLFSNGLFKQQNQAGFYIYQAKWNQHTQTGFVGLGAISDYTDGLIKVHEHTRADREAQIEAYFGALSLNTTPVLVSFPVDNVLNTLLYKLVQKPAYCNLQISDLVVNIWKVTTPLHIHAISQGFANLPSLYIADGHHRAKTAQLFAKSNTQSMAAQYFPILAVPASELTIFGFYRQILQDNSFDFEAILQKLKTNFVFKRVNLSQMFYQYLPENHFLLVTKQDCWLINPRNKFPSFQSPVSELDVSLLHSEILEPYFQIVDAKTDKRISFGTVNIQLSDFEKLVSQPDTLCVFLTQAPSIDNVFNVADAGEVMPPKSTSFEPKVASGVLMYGW